jgi:hypothetical protein
VLRKLIRKERLSGSEAETLLSSIDKRLFFEQLISLLKYKHLLSEDELLSLFNPTHSKEPLNLPISIFNNTGLSALETICKYLKEQKGLRFSEIASILNRDQRTIWVTYDHSCKKREEPLVIADSEYSFPLSILKNRKLSVLEAIVAHLKDSYHLRYTEIARLIKRDERNIWAIYNKAGKKLENEQTQD